MGRREHGLRRRRDVSRRPLLALVLALVAAFLILFLLPLVLFAVEAAVLTVLVYVFGRWWIVEATATGLPPRRWRVRGWLASRRVAGEVARAIERGEAIEPKRAEPVPGP